MKDEMARVVTACYELAAQLRLEAEAACKRGDPDAVHFLVSEYRRVGNLPRVLKMRGIVKDE